MGHRWMYFWNKRKAKYMLLKMLILLKYIFLKMGKKCIGRKYIYINIFWNILANIILNLKYIWKYIYFAVEVAKTKTIKF